MIAYLVIVAIAGVAAAFVLAPLFRPDAAEAERVARAMSAEQEMTARHAMSVAALRDLEEDRATGKIGDSDYAEMKAKLTSDALETMKALDALSGERR